MRRLGLVGPIAVLLVTAATALIVTFGPEPFRPASVPGILQPERILVEQRDQWVLLAWWLIAAAMAVAFAIAPGLTTRGVAPRDVLAPHTSAARSRGIVVAIGALALGVILLALMWNPDVPGWLAGAGPRGYDLPEIAAGLLLLLAFVLMRFVSRGLRVFAATILTTGLLVATAFALVQPPGGVRDVDSFIYVLGDLTAVANGQLPLADYFPLYSSLLGMPVAPLISAFPEASVWFVLGWLLALQVATIVAAVAFVRVAAPRWMTVAILFVVIPPIVATNALGFSVATYFAGFPLRCVLPMATLLVAARLLVGPSWSHRRQLLQFTGLGLLGGAAALNNVDFGGAVLVAVLVATAVSALRWKDALVGVTAVAVGAAAVVGAYALLIVATGHALDLSAPFLFLRYFGTTGVGAAAMDAFGIHIAYVVAFVSATVIGVAVLVSRYGRRASWLRRQGVVLLLAGSWGLICLPYFAGRSYSATVVGGLSFNAAVVVAALMPMLWAGWRAVRMRISSRRTEAAAAVALGATAVIACMGLTVQISTPTNYAALMTRDDPTRLPQLADQVGALEAWKENAVAGDGPVAGAVRDNAVQLLLPMSSLTSAETGLPSRMVVAGTLYFRVSLEVAALQCRAGWTDSTRYVLMEPDTAAAMAREPACTAVLDFSHALPAAGADRAFELVPTRTTSRIEPPMTPSLP